MPIKKIDFSLNCELPVVIDIISGNLSIIFDNSSYAEIEYANFSIIEPDIKNNITDKNMLSIANILEGDTNIFLHLLSDIKETNITSNSGDIKVQNSKSILSISSFNGDVFIASCSGKIKMESCNGFVKINGFNGNLDIDSSNGTVQIFNWDSTGGTIESTTGAIVVGLNTINQDIELKSKNSKIALGVSKECSVEITARGSDVMNYLDKSTGESLGSPAFLKLKNGKNKIGIFSNNEKVQIAGLDDLDKISPDMEKIFQEFDIEFKKSFVSFVKGSKDFGKKASIFGKNFAENISSLFKKEKKDQSVKENNSSAKMEILQMLKEGKITAEEAEKLLNALK